MKRITVPLLLGLTVAAVGCGKTEETPVTGSTALSISGSLKSSTAAMLNASRIDQYDAWAASAPQYSMLVTYSDFIVSCVTFSVPPVAGSGGTVGSDGKFSVTFPEGTVGQSFGCFISKPADTNFDPIPMVFKDSTKKSMSGEDKKDTRLAVTGSISIPEVKLDLENGTAEVDTATIVKTETNTTTDVVKTVTGTKFDFTGNWVIESLAQNNIVLPSGYQEVCTFDQMFADEWSRMQNGGSGDKACDGPIVGMKLYLLRMAGKAFARDSSCVAAVEASKTTGGSIGTCNGTAGTDDRFAIKLWAPEGGKGGGGMDKCRPIGEGGNEAECKVQMQAMINALDPRDGFHECGRKMGFTNNEAKAFGEVDFSSDPNYLSSGSSSGATDTHYYEGAFPFASTVTVPADQAGGCAGGMCKPFSAAGPATLTDGWKVDTAQTQWAQQNNCKPVDVMVGTAKMKAWRCYGNMYPNCTITDTSQPCNNTGTAIAAFNEGAGGGCVDEAGTIVQFDNWQDFWCNGEGGCTQSCDPAQNVSWINSDGTLTAAGYNVSNCAAKSGFEPTRNGQPVSHSGTVKCKSGGQLFNAGTSQPFDWQTYPNAWQKFRATQATAGTACKDMPTNSANPEEQNRQKLAQLQCYSNAYWRVADSIQGCVRRVDFNWGAQNWWDFVSHDDGPSKARGEVIFELFNYTDTNSGTFSTVESYDHGVESQDTYGNRMWVPCRINRNETITLTSISATKLLVEMVSQSTLVNKDNKVCVKAQEDGKIESGTSKGMFVMTKQ